MSHIEKITSDGVTDVTILKATCQTLKLPEPVYDQHKLFRSTAEGWGVRLKGWKYPAVFDITTGQCHYDNFSGRWGEIAELHGFIQKYSVEQIVSLARSSGHTYQVNRLANGNIHLHIEEPEQERVQLGAVVASGPAL